MYRLILVLLLFALVGCTQPPTAPTDQATPTTPPSNPIVEETPQIQQAPTTESTSESIHTGSLSGRVISNTNGDPIGQTLVALAQVYRDVNDPSRAAFALDLANSPATFTDDDGNFMFTGIEPNEYIISVGDLYGTKDIVREPNGDARVYKLEADQTVNVGVVRVDPNVMSK